MYGLDAASNANANTATATATTSLSIDATVEEDVDDGHVLADACVRRYLRGGEAGEAQTWLLEDGTGRLCALVTLQPFDALGMAHGDDNLFELCLLAAAVRGAGRALLALALLLAADERASGVVLELLGGYLRKKALLRMFDFVIRGSEIVSDCETSLLCSSIARLALSASNALPKSRRMRTETAANDAVVVRGQVCETNTVNCWST